MGHFFSKYSHGNKFKVDSTDFPFCELSELVKENGHKILKVQGAFTYKTKKNKTRPCLIADSHKINLPDHMLKEIEKMLMKICLIIHKNVTIINEKYFFIIFCKIKYKSTGRVN